MNYPFPELTRFPFPADYADLTRRMESRVDAIVAGQASESLWLAEFPPLYTAGTGADPARELLAPDRFPVFQTGRGGKMTYHGPGQRVAYVMLNLAEREAKDVRLYVTLLETWIIRTLAVFSLEGFRMEDRTGVWVRDPSAPEGVGKIAALGVRVRKWITFHGVALNVCPDVNHFQGVVPCGLQGSRAASMKGLGVAADMEEVDRALLEAFASTFDCLPYSPTVLGASCAP